jgi:Spy/CpxP family protein refolding chaperone
MSNMKKSSALIPMLTILGGAAGLAVAVVLAAAAVSVTPRSASATPAYAAETKLPCGRCHVNPAGGGPNTPFGKEFAANGHKLKK